MSYNVELQASTAGTYRGVVSLESNDTLDSPYTIKLDGEAGVAGPDVAMYLVAKGQQYTQTSTAAAQLAAGNPYVFAAQVVESYSSSVTSATVHTPGGSTDTLAPATDVTAWNTSPASHPRASSTRPSPKRTYQFSMVTADNGTQTPALSLPADAYPNAPHVTDWTAAQSVTAAPISSSRGMPCSRARQPTSSS